MITPTRGLNCWADGSLKYGIRWTLDPTFTVAGTAVDFDLTSVVSRDSPARTVGWAPAESVDIEAST